MNHHSKSVKKPETTLSAREQHQSIYVEHAKLLMVDQLPSEHILMRFAAPAISMTGFPGQFVQIKCTDWPMLRRSMSLLRADRDQGWFEILFKVYGAGTEVLAQRKVGDVVNIMGPIGQAFKQCSLAKRPLLIGTAHGMQPILFLARHIQQVDRQINPLVILGVEYGSFPFIAKPSQILVHGLPSEVIAAMPGLDDLGIASRLATQQSSPGCYEGSAQELAEHWLKAQSQEQLDQVEIFAAGPRLLVKAIAALAKQYSLPCQISMEETMACAVGGCAGCVISVQTEAGIAMKRVCVDGPIFDAASVVFS